MATTYALPAAPGHVGHHTHIHSPSRKPAGQRSSVHSGSVHGTQQYNTTAAGMNSDAAAHQGQASQSYSLDTATRSAHTPQQSGEAFSRPSSFTSPNMARTKSMDRRKSFGLPTHLNLQDQRHSHAAEHSHVLGTEATGKAGRSTTLITYGGAVLIPLYCTLAWLAFERQTPKQALRDSANMIPGGAAQIHQSDVQSHHSLQVICIIVSLTLGLLGISAKLLPTRDRPHPTSQSFSIKKMQGLGYGQLTFRILSRYMMLGLPLFASSCVGGIRAGVLLLALYTSGITASGPRSGSLFDMARWKSLPRSHAFLVAAVLLQFFCDLVGFTSHQEMLSICAGYFSILLASTYFSPQFGNCESRFCRISSGSQSVSSSDWKPLSSHAQKSSYGAAKSALIGTPEDIDLTILSAVILGLASLISCFVLQTHGDYISPKLILVLATSSIAALSFHHINPAALQEQKVIIPFFASIGCVLFAAALHGDTSITIIYGTAFGAAIWSAVGMDQYVKGSGHGDHHIHTANSSIDSGTSRLTKFLLHKARPWPLLHTIIAEKDSRRIFYFMLLNFAFMIVQTFYGIVSGSLGLLSDSIHMFFDCLALIVGLSAAVMSKWPPSQKFPYGYAKIETLAGFANGIFLMLISVEIVAEALERLSSGRDIKRVRELMIVSIMGLLINLIGILAFGHAHHGHDHGHSHGQDHGHAHSHGHGHDHEEHHHHSHKAHSSHEHIPHEHVHQQHGDLHHHDHNGTAVGPRQDMTDSQRSHEHQHQCSSSHQHSHSHEVIGPSPSVYSSVPATPVKSLHQQPATHEKAPTHSHSHDHHHSENMLGIYLHVLGDALGSAAVVLSTWLISRNGWSGWDPLASSGIAIIIFGTAIPLVKNCAQKLLLTVPEDTEYDLREALAGLNDLRGVVGCTVPKFWIQEGEQRKTMGVVHVIVDRVSSLEDVKEKCVAFLQSRQLDVLVQVERDGVSRCWCQTSK